jgi:polyisoprenoid-binding protein YceI
MKHLKLSACLAIALISACAAFAQSDRSRVDPGHSTASLYLQAANDASSALNVAIAKVSGTAYWDRDKPSNSIFNLSIYPAVQDSQLLAEDGSFRKDGLANLARYTLLTFQSKSAALDRSGKLLVAGNLTVAYVEREASQEWSAAYTGAVPGDPVVRRSTHEVHLIVENVAPNEGREWPAAKPDLFGSIATTEEAAPGLKHALRDAVWPIVVEDERCEMPAPTADMRAYQGAICSGTPLLVEPSGKMPAWSSQGYSGSIDPNPALLQHVSILLRLRLLEPKLRKASGLPE